MASTLKRLGRGLAAGLVSVGGSIEKMEEQKRQDKLRQEQEAREEKRFQAQRRDAEIRNEQLRIQNQMNQTKLNHEAMVNAARISEFDPEVMADALTKNIPDGRAYIFNPAESVGGKIVMDVGTLATNPDGTLQQGSDGKPIFQPGPGRFNKKVWNNKADFVSDMSKRMNPQSMFAQQILEMDGKKARQQMEIAEEAARKRDEASGKKEKTVAEADLARARAERLRAETEDPARFRQQTAAGEKVDTIIGIGGEENKLTSQAVNRLRESTKSLRDRFPGITAEETFRLDQVRQNAELRNTIRQAAQAVVDEVEGVTEKAVVDSLMTDFKISRPVAQEILREEMEGLESQKPSFFERMFK